MAIKKHCTATADEIRAEAAKYAKYFDDAEALELGFKFMAKDWHHRQQSALTAKG